MLTRNSLVAIEGFEKLTNLTKLSLSENKIRTIPEMRQLVELTELKLNKNALFKIPDTIALHRKLKVLDLGHNVFTNIKYIAFSF